MTALYVDQVYNSVMRVRPNVPPELAAVDAGEKPSLGESAASTELASAGSTSMQAPRASSDSYASMGAAEDKTERQIMPKKRPTSSVEPDTKRARPWPKNTPRPPPMAPARPLDYE